MFNFLNAHSNVQTRTTTKTNKLFRTQVESHDIRQDCIMRARHRFYKFTLAQHVQKFVI